MSLDVMIKAVFGRNAHRCFHVLLVRLSNARAGTLKICNEQGEYLAVLYTQSAYTASLP
jgi:hypothetical protein